MNILHSLFGEMVGYGVNQKYKGDVDSVHALQDYKHIYVIHPDKYSEIYSLGVFLQEERVRLRCRSQVLHCVQEDYCVRNIFNGCSV